MLCERCVSPVRIAAANIIVAANRIADSAKRRFEKGAIMIEQLVWLLQSV